MCVEDAPNANSPVNCVHGPTSAQPREVVARPCVPCVRPLMGSARAQVARRLSQPNHVSMRFASSAVVAGILALPLGAQVPALSSAPTTVSTGRGSIVQSFTIPSRILGESRLVHVVLPEGYATAPSTRRFPVTIVLDGEANVPPAAAVSDELARNGQIPEAIIVAIPNTDSYSGRVRDLTPPGLSISGSSRNERGDLFLDFIERELLPAIDTKFHGGEPRTFIGHSSGGILATWVAATRPAFRAVIAIDAPTHHDDDWLARQLITRVKSSKVGVRYVSIESRFGWSERNWQALEAAAPKSWKLTRIPLQHESHESMGMLGMYLGLREAYADYSVVQAPMLFTTQVLPWYDTVSASLGTRVLPPRRALRSVFEDLMMEGWGRQARSAWTQYVSAYGAPRDSAQLLAELAKVERRPEPTETVASLLSTPFSTPEQVAEYLGEWQGDIWMSADEPRNGRTTLRIWVVDGKVHGESISHVASDSLVQAWTYFKVTPTGFTYGYMNGMRPRGMLMHEAKRVAPGQIRGEINFGGINFVRPEGMSDDKIQFEFRRRTR